MAEEPGAAPALLLERSHTASPLQVSQLVDEAARRLGTTSAAVYLADVQEDQLVPLPGTDRHGDVALTVEGTVAGWAYRTMALRLSRRRPLTVWVPLIDGMARIGNPVSTPHAVRAPRAVGGRRSVRSAPCPAAVRAGPGRSHRRRPNGRRRPGR